jgi:hypothetical protein
MSEKKYTYNYNILKKDILKSIIRHKENILKFKVDQDKLDSILEDGEIELQCLNTGIHSRPLREEDIPYISVYFKDEKLEWFDVNAGKQFTAIVLIDKKSIDEECLDLIEKLNIKDPNSDLDIDRGKVLAKILAKYPCLIAQIISYKSNNPDFKIQSSFTIGIKANTVLIKNEQYRYNDADI